MNLYCPIPTCPFPVRQPGRSHRREPGTAAATRRAPPRQTEAAARVDAVRLLRRSSADEASVVRARHGKTRYFSDPSARGYCLDCRLRHVDQTVRDLRPTTGITVRHPRPANLAFSGGTKDLVKRSSTFRTGFSGVVTPPDSPPRRTADRAARAERLGRTDRQRRPPRRAGAGGRGFVTASATASRPAVPSTRGRSPVRMQWTKSFSSRVELIAGVAVQLARLKVTAEQLRANRFEAGRDPVCANRKPACSVSAVRLR